MNIYDVLQLIGGFILTFGNVPQICQTLKTKSVNDLNFKTFLSIFVGIFFMEIYAINLVLNNAGHMFLVTNSLALFTSGIMVFLIFKYRAKGLN